MLIFLTITSKPLGKDHHPLPETKSRPASSSTTAPWLSAGEKHKSCRLRCSHYHMYLLYTLITPQGQLSVFKGNKTHLIKKHSFLLALYPMTMHIADVKQKTKQKTPTTKKNILNWSLFHSILNIFLLFAVQKHFEFHVSTYGKEE